MIGLGGRRLERSQRWMAFIKSTTTAWGVLNETTREVCAYPSSKQAAEVAIYSHDHDGDNLWLCFYHPDHGWVEWATHRRVSDGRRAKKLGNARWAMTPRWW